MKRKNISINIPIQYHSFTVWMILLLGLTLLMGCAQSPIRTADKNPNAKYRLQNIPVELIPKSYWADEIMYNPAEADPMGSITRITIHHDGLSSKMINTHPQIAERILDIQNAHIKRNWADIGYHLIVDPLGDVWEGRPLQYQGAHVKDNNEENIGILVLGNFQYSEPTGKAMNTLNKLMNYLMKKYQIDWNHVFTHRELVPNRSNECPGRYLQVIIEKARQSGGLLSSQ